MVIALIVAAGQGRRMQSPVAKQYIELAGRPVLGRTLDIFCTHPMIDRIVVVVAPADMGYCRRRVLATLAAATVPVVLVAGGSTRQQSVYNGLRAAQADPKDIVVIHDGVRPFLPSQLLTTAIRTASVTGACLLALPLMDTPKAVTDGAIVQTTLPRSGTWLAQTPQAFRAAIIGAAHEKAHCEGFDGTDDAQLVERLGIAVHVVRGSVRNIKITTPEDLFLAEAILSCSDQQAQMA